MPEQFATPGEETPRESHTYPWWAARWTFRSIIKAIIALSLVWALVLLVFVAIFTQAERELVLALLATLTGLTTSALNHYFAKDSDE